MEKCENFWGFLFRFLNSTAHFTVKTHNRHHAILGYQKSKAEETRILESLRDEGLLAKPKGKTAGGVSFEVVDATILSKTEADPEGESKKDAFVSADFIPSKTLRRLESRRGVRFNFILFLGIQAKLGTSNSLTLYSLRGM